MIPLDPALAWTVRLVAACLLAVAAGSKMAALEPFVGVVRNYRLLPPALVRPAAYAIPPFELLIAATLLALPASAFPPAGAALLLLVFAGAMAVNIARGRSEIDCGCFVGFMRQRLSWTLVARNLALAVALLLAAVGSGGSRATGWLDGVTVAAGAGSLLLVWAIVGRLFGTAPRARLAEAG